MGEYLRSADQILRAAGIPPGAPSTAELLKALAEGARDWADSAAALGASIDPLSATRMAAHGLAADPLLLKRLEELEAGASEVMSRLQASMAQDQQDSTTRNVPARPRRWGQDGQPSGSTATNPFADDVREADGPELRTISALDLLGLPAYDTEGKFVGQIETIMLARVGGDPVGVKLKRS